MIAQLFKIADINISTRRRRQAGDISALAESILEVGLLNPITIVIRELSDGSPDGITETPILVAGLHRLEAFKAMGEEEIPCVVLDLDGLDAELAEIDENLIRDELTTLERDEHLKRRQEIFEAKSGGKIPSLGGRGNVGFAADTAEKVGLEKSTINKSIKRIKEIPEDVRSDIADTPIADSGAELDALAKVGPAEQRRAVAKVKSGEARTVRQALARPDKAPVTEKQLKSLQRAWMQAGKSARDQFLEWIEKPKLRVVS